MDLCSRKKVKKLLKDYNLRPSEKLGQNFLVSKSALTKTIQAANLKSEHIVLEIGPGIGTLTRALAQRVKKVIAIEKDKRLIKVLHQTLNDLDNVEIIPGDIRELQTTNDKLQITNSYKVVSNLPYYLSSFVIRKLLESKHPPNLMVLIIQKEVAQRIIAKPPNMRLLSVAVQFYAQPTIEGYISSSEFWPQPKVDAAILKVVPQPEPKVNPNLFFKIVRAGFAHPRKQLVNNLSSGLELNKNKTRAWLLRSNIKPEQRAETLTITDWIKLLSSSSTRASNLKA